MTKWLSNSLCALISLFRARRDLAFKNLLLRQQIAALKGKGVRPQLTPIIGVRAKTKRFKPTLNMSTPDMMAFLEAATWQALNTGLVFENDKFRQEVEHLAGQRQRHLKRGPVAGFKLIRNQSIFTLTPNIDCGTVSHI